MPIIEANATGRVVVTSNLPPMTEVGGQAAFYVNPFDVDEIKQTIIKVIDDEESRNEHIALGLENTKRFSRDIMKSLTIQGYDELVDMYGDLIYYIEKHRDLLLSGCVGLTNAQQEIKKEYETLLDFNQKSFKHLEKLLIERQNLINNKEE